MHLLEAFLAWHTVTGDREYLRRAARIIGLFRSHFFDPESWTLGEYFDDDWKPAPNGKGEWTEPGHHFEWASLLVDFAEKSGQKDLVGFARKLYASAIANGLNRATGLAYARGVAAGRCRSTWSRAAGRRPRRSRRRLRSTARRPRPQAGDRGARRPAVPLAYRPGAARAVDRPDRRAGQSDGDRSAGQHLLSPGWR